MLAVAALFLVANRGAYKSFFTDDDLDHIVNARVAEFLYYEQMLITPRLGGDETFRPVGHFYYFAMERVFGLRFVPYITGIHVLHLVNVLLIWFLARALGAAPLGAFAAALFYAFHAGAYQMY